MDEIWKDISLISTLHNPNAAAPATTSTVFEFQDILSQPSPSFTKVNSTRSQPTTSNRKQQKQKEVVSGCNHTKRPPPEADLDDHSGDGRFKRMIKNRESAARSRERKHAYTYELELELARLKRVNAKLKKQQELLSMPAPPTPPAMLPKKATLRRTLTAPF